MEPAISQTQHERGRVVAGGRRTDDGSRCELLVVREVGGTWALYPHGAGKFGVRLPASEAATVQAFLTGDAR